jgi:hypothetical protein
MFWALTERPWLVQLILGLNYMMHFELPLMLLLLFVNALLLVVR